MSDEESWHLDKRVPIALIVSLLTQSAVLVWWGAGMNHQVDANTKELAERRLLVQSIPVLAEKHTQLDTNQVGLLTSVSTLERQSARTELMMELLLKKQGIDLPK